MAKKNSGGNKKKSPGFTKDELRTMADEINVVCELDEEDQIDPNQHIEALESELKSAVTGSEPEIELMTDDEFTDYTWNLLEKLGCETARKRRELQETEEIEEQETEEIEAEGEEEDEEVGIEISADFVNSTKKLSDLKAIVKEHDEFKSLRSSVDQYKGSKGLTQLKQDMVNLLEGNEDEEPEPEKKEKPKKQESKKAKEQPTPQKKKGVFGGKKITKIGKGTMETLADLVAEGRYTKKDFVEKAVELGVSESCAKTYLSHGKKEANIKRLKLANPIMIGDDGIVELKGIEEKKSSGGGKKGNSKKKK